MRRIKHKIRKGKCGRIWGNCWAEIVTEGLAVISVILRNTNVNWMSWGDGNLMMLLFWILLFWCFYFVFLSITQLILRNKTLQLKDSKLLLYVNVFSPQSHFFFFFFFVYQETAQNEGIGLMGLQGNFKILWQYVVKRQTLA